MCFIGAVVAMSNLKVVWNMTFKMILNQIGSVCVAFDFCCFYHGLLEFSG